MLGWCDRGSTPSMTKDREGKNHSVDYPEGSVLRENYREKAVIRTTGICDLHRV